MRARASVALYINGSIFNVTVLDGFAGSLPWRPNLRTPVCLSEFDLAQGKPRHVQVRQRLPQRFYSDQQRAIVGNGVFKSCRRDVSELCDGLREPDGLITGSAVAQNSVFVPAAIKGQLKQFASAGHLEQTSQGCSFRKDVRHQKASAEAARRYFRFKLLARSAGKQRCQLFGSERRAVVLEYQFRAFAVETDGDRAPAARPGIQSVLEQLERPPKARGMRVAARLMYADAYPPCLIARVLLAQGAAEEIICFLGHSRSAQRSSKRATDCRPFSGCRSGQCRPRMDCTRPLTTTTTSISRYHDKYCSITSASA